VDQLGIEMHTGNALIGKSAIKRRFNSLIIFMKAMLVDYGLKLVSYNANGCLAKKNDATRNYYSFHDALFVKVNISN
jgi:hypothetical protein